LGGVREEDAGAVPAEECLVMTYTRLTINERELAARLLPHLEGRVFT